MLEDTNTFTNQQFVLETRNELLKLLVKLKERDRRIFLQLKQVKNEQN